MQRILAGLTLALAAFCFVGCSGPDSSNASDTTTVAVEGEQQAETQQTGGGSESKPAGSGTR